MHEVLINNVDPRSVLTWDFDVLGQAIIFSVFRTNQHIEGDGK